MAGVPAGVVKRHRSISSQCPRNTEAVKRPPVVRRSSKGSSSPSSPSRSSSRSSGSTWASNTWTAIGASRPGRNASNGCAGTNTGTATTVKSCYATKYGRWLYQRPGEDD